MPFSVFVAKEKQLHAEKINGVDNSGIGTEVSKTQKFFMSNFGYIILVFILPLAYTVVLFWKR